MSDEGLAFRLEELSRHIDALEARWHRGEEDLKTRVGQLETRIEQLDKAVRSLEASRWETRTPQVM